MADNRFTPIEGLSKAFIQRRGIVPLRDVSTYLAALAKALGVPWFPTPSFSAPGNATAFLDETEEIPATAEGEPATLRRTVTWVFLADHTIAIDGETLSPGDLFERVRAGDDARLRPNSLLGTLAAAYHLEPEPLQPSRRIAAIRERLLAPLPPDGQIAPVLARSLEVYRGLCHKLQATEPHPEYGEPLTRHLLIRQGNTKAWVPYDSTPEVRTSILQKYGMA